MAVSLFDCVQVRNSQLTAQQADKLRALAARCLLGLAKDTGIRNMLTKLQLGRLLSDILRDPTVSSSRRNQGVAGNSLSGQHHTLP